MPRPKKTNPVGRPKTGETFKRTNFSLDEETSSMIDEISFLPTGFRASRSDVVKAAIRRFNKLSDTAKIKALKEEVVK